MNTFERLLTSVLQHPSIIRKWYSCIGGCPGYTQEAFTALNLRAQEDKKANKKRQFAL